MQKLNLFLNKLRTKKEILLLISITIIILYPLLLNPYGKIFPFNDVSTYASWKTFLSESIRSFGNIPFWNPYFFSGAPFLGNSQVGIFYPVNIIYLLIPIQNAFSYAFLIDYLLIGLFTYKYVRLIGLGKQGAVVASLCMIFNGSLMKQLFLGHIIILDSITWFPLLMYLFEKSLIKKTIKYSLISGIVFGLMILAGNIQMPIYALIASSAYYFIRLFQERERVNLKKNLSLISLPFITFFVGLCLTAIQIIPTYEFSLLSARSKGISFDFASAYSFNPKQLVVIILPSLFGSDVNNTYWGIGSFWSSSIYMGIIPFFLAIIAFFYKRNKYFFSLLVLLILSLFYSFGKYGLIFKLSYNLIPFFNDFRVPTRILFVFAFSLSVFSGFGTQYILTNFKNKKLEFKRLLKLLSLVFIGAGIIFITLSRQEPSLSLFEKYILRNSYAQGISHISLLLLIQNDILIFCFFAFCFLIFLILFYFKKISKKVLFFLIILLISIDCFSFYSKFYIVNNTNKIYDFKNEFSYIKKDKEKFRVFIFPSGSENLASNNKIETITGFDPLYLSSYRNFLWQTGPHENTPYESFIIINKITNLNVLKELNVKYVISKNKLYIKGLSEVFKNKYYIYIVDNFYKRAYSIYLDTPNFNLNNINFGKAEITEYNPNKIIVDLKMKNRGYLILSENYFPGWTAYDNGEKIEIIRSNKIFRAVFLKPGNHKVEFKYNPFSYEIGKIITLLSTSSIFIYYLFLYRRNLCRSTKKYIK